MARTAGSEGTKTEAAIREAAVELIARHGFEGVSMRRLAEAVGVQAGTLYRYFPTKQALLASMMREHMRHLIDSWRRARPATDDPAALLSAFARFHVRYHMDRRDEVFINYMELRSLDPENAPEIVALRKEYEGELRAILAQGVAKGVFRTPDVPVTAMALIAMLTGVTTWRQAGGRLGPQAIADIYTRLTLDAVGARASVEA
ncbi:MAG: TetR/AcrR family transcriptional regulator [Rhodobacteraceae bacterium]|nr:MAG: TetR/AcrR family transcriptional regulator [Paracoccaceae bacterium]